MMGLKTLKITMGFKTYDENGFESFDNDNRFENFDNDNGFEGFEGGES